MGETEVALDVKMVGELATSEAEEVPGVTEDNYAIGHTSVERVVSGLDLRHSQIPEILDHLNSEELTALRIHFYEKKVDEKIKEPKGSAHPRFRGSKLNKEEFIFAIQQVIGTTKYDDAASDLFEHLVKDNAEEHKGFLWWEQVVDEMLEYMAEKTKSRPGNIVKESFCSLHTMPHCRRETIVRVVPVETSKSFCFVVVSKYGKVGIYDWKMNLLVQYEVKLSTQIATTASGEVRRTTWVTDAVYMGDAATLLVAASDRSLHFYSTSGLVCVPVYHISGLPNTPTCLHYTPGTSVAQSMLLVGDDQGSIATVYFHQPQYALFKRTSNDSYDKYFWKELSTQKAWVTIFMDQGIHKDEITRVEYFSDNNTVVSCSNDPNTTLIIRYIVGRRAPYVFKIARGVRCFHLDRSLRLLATGGKDSVVRLWNPIIPRKPVASLFGHKTCVVDVRILKHLKAILSVSKDTVVKVWDMEKHICMQSLPLLFPVHGALSRTPEFGLQSFYPGPVTCKPPVVTPKKPSTVVFFPARTVVTDSAHDLEKSESTLVDSLSKKSASSIANIDELVSETGKSVHRTVSNTTASTVTHNFPAVASLGEGSSSAKSKAVSQFTLATERSDDDSSCIDSPYTRMELLAVSCNYVVILQLSERDLEEGEDKRVGKPLDPPLRNQDPVAPSPWLTVDDGFLTGLADIDSQKTPGGDDGVSPVPPDILAMLQKSLGDEMTRDLTSLAASCYSRKSQQTDLKQIRTMVDQCAPHLALGTTKLEDIPFTIPSPVQTRKGRRKEKEAHAKETKITRVSPDESDTLSSRLDTTTTTSTSTSISFKY